MPNKGGGQEIDMYKLCAFDMDGTFVDSLGDIAAAMNRALVKLGFDEYPTDAYKQMVGSGMTVLCKRALPNADDAAVEKLVAEYNADYLKNCCVKTAPYDGMVELVKHLKNSGAKCVILSNKPHQQACEIAEKIIPSGLFDEILGKTERFPIKPAPDSLLYLMDKFGVTKAETAYVGDSDVDIKLGKAADVFTVGVSWGFRGEDELLSAGAQAVAHTPSELEKILMR